MKLTSFFLTLILIVFVPRSIFAEQRLVEAEGLYIESQAMEEDYVCYTKAKNEALRQATEQAGVYIKSVAYSKNYTLTSDEIESIAAGNIKVIDEKKTCSNTVQGKEYICKIKAMVDIDSSVFPEILNYRNKNANSPYFYIADNLVVIAKGQKGNVVLIDPTSIYFREQGNNVTLAFKNVANTEVAIVDISIKPLEALYCINEAKNYDPKTGRFLGNLPIALHQWKNYIPNTPYDIAQKFIMKQSLQSANDFMIKYYDKIKNDAKFLAQKHIKFDKDLYYFNTTFQKFDFGEYNVTPSFFIPGTIKAANDSIATVKVIHVSYAFDKDPLTNDYDDTKSKILLYIIEEWEFNNISKTATKKHSITYSTEGNITKEIDTNWVIDIEPEPLPIMPTLVSSISGFNNKYIK